MQQRLHGLDFLRALMMMLGIVLHGSQMYMTMHLGFDYYSDPQKSPLMDAILIFINTFRMPVFFVLSGFFTALLFTRRGRDAVIKNRYQRIALPFIVFFIPMALLLDLQFVLAQNLMATGAYGLSLEHVQLPWVLWNNTHHLWFLWYLMCILLLHLVLAKVYNIAPSSIRRSLNAQSQKIAAPRLFGLITLGLVFGALAYHSPVGRLGGGIRWMPYLPSLAWFGLLYAFGWFLYQRKEILEEYSRNCWRYLAWAAVFFVLALAGFALQAEPESTNYPTFHSLLSFGNGIAMCCMIVGFIGVFHRYCNNFNPWTRYFSDASYWIFLAHQPVLLLFAIPMYHLPLIAELKFLLCITATFIVCTVTYHYWVRNTTIGQLLNGERFERRLPYPEG